MASKRKKATRKRSGPQTKRPTWQVSAIRVKVKGEAWFQQLAHKIFTESEEDSERRHADPEHLDNAGAKLIAKGVSDLFAPKHDRQSRKRTKRPSTKRPK